MVDFKATNKSGVQHAYFMRELYRERAFENIDLANPIDMWYNKMLYGRVNPRGETILLSETFLKPVRSGSVETIQAVNFVADAFKEFQLYYEKAIQRGKVQPTGVLYDLQARKGFPAGGFNNFYHVRMEALYNVFVNSYLPNLGRERELKDFKTFAKFFIEYIVKVSGQNPVTKTNVLLSRFADPLSTGLILELFVADHGNDILKTKLFIDDVNLNFYQDALNKFGFLMDFNAPWRIVADLKSPVMQKYMEPYGATFENIFDAYYYKTFINDIDTLKVYMFGFYNSYIAAQPFARTIQQKCGSLRRVLIARNAIDPADFTQSYGDLFWLKLYLKLRATEAQLKWTDAEFAVNVRQVYELKKTLDMSTAIRYINNLTMMRASDAISNSLR